MGIKEPLCTATQEGKELFNELHEKFAQDPSEENVKKHIKNTHLEYLAQGDSRIVLVDRDGAYLSAANACVVKINKYGENSSNLMEHENWQRIKGEAEDHLMRITDWDSDYRWLVMPHVSTEVTDEMLIELEKTLLRNGYKIRDVHQRNCARVQDRAVMIDYDQFIGSVDFGVMGMEERERLIEWKYE